MKIRTAYQSAAPSNMAWLAIDDDTYDGSPDSSTRGQIGYGATEQEAIADLKRLFQEN